MLLTEEEWKEDYPNAVKKLNGLVEEVMSIYSVHAAPSSYYMEAMARLDSVFVPKQCDWHEAYENKRLLESKGYKLDVHYPFECCGGFHDAYEQALCKLGYDNEVDDLPF